jgi:hypothetical protein
MATHKHTHTHIHTFFEGQGSSEMWQRVTGQKFPMDSYFALEMKGPWTFHMPGTIYPTTQYNILQDHHLPQHGWANLTPCIILHFPSTHFILNYNTYVSTLRSLVTGFSPWNPGFTASAVHEWFVDYKELHNHSLTHASSGGRTIRLLKLHTCNRIWTTECPFYLVIDHISHIT